jgi:hypothetical protein
MSLTAGRREKRSITMTDGAQVQDLPILEKQHFQIFSVPAP